MDFNFYSTLQNQLVKWDLHPFVATLDHEGTTQHLIIFEKNKDRAATIVYYEKLKNDGLRNWIRV